MHEFVFKKIYSGRSPTHVELCGFYKKLVAETFGSIDSFGSAEWAHANAKLAKVRAYFLFFAPLREVISVQA